MLVKPVQSFIRHLSLLMLSISLTACGPADLPGLASSINEQTNKPAPQDSAKGQAAITTIAPRLTTPVVPPTETSLDTPNSPPASVIETTLYQEPDPTDAPKPGPTATFMPTPTLTPVPTPTRNLTPTPEDTATPPLPPTPTALPPPPPPPPPPVPTPVPTSPVPTATHPPPAPTPAPAPTPTPTPTPAPAGPSWGIFIECIFYDGVVPGSESDEYVQLINSNDVGVDLAGWLLRDIADDTPSFVFPNHPVQPGGKVRVYTDEVHPEWGGFSFGRGTSIWNNNEKDPDTAALFNPQGQMVSDKSYPPGC